MSNATPLLSPERDERLYLRDMLQFCERAIAYTQGLSFEAVMADPMRYDATLRNLELIGEAATHVPAPLRMQAPDIEWRRIVGTRNRVAHAYLGIEAETVWLIVTEHLPVLRDQLHTLIARSAGGGSGSGRVDRPD